MGLRRAPLAGAGRGCAVGQCRVRWPLPDEAGAVAGGTDGGWGAGFSLSQDTGSSEHREGARVDSRCNASDEAPKMHNQTAA